MIWKVLKSEFRLWQSLGIMVLISLGISVILLTIRFYADIKPAFRVHDLWETEQIIISKKIKSDITASQLLGKSKKPGFSPDEIENIKSLPFIDDVAIFESGHFQTIVRIDSKLLDDFYSEIFFESVPAHIISIPKNTWTWQQGDEFIPIILPKFYLNLYNFGFASTQNLPQISEKAAYSIPFQITLIGNEHKKQFSARIVGFTDKINSILVPQNFLQYANSTFATSKSLPSRLVLLTKNPSAPELLAFLSEQDYDYNQSLLNNSKAQILINTGSSIVLIIGLIISLMAFWLFMMTSQLFLYRSKDKIHILKILGYSQKEILFPMIISHITIYFTALSLSIIPFSIIKSLYRENLTVIIAKNSISDLWLYIILIIFLCFITIANMIRLQTKLRHA
jgi:hypothetical protein